MRAAPSLLSIEVSFDLICPWCFIGKRHLEAALAQLRAERPDVEVSVEWRSVPLIPDTPLEGVSYREFYVARLGSPEAVATRQAQVLAAAREAGLELALTRIERFPNTLLAHRLVRFARQEVGAEAAGKVIENLLERYFLRGEDIGDAGVLREAVLEAGVVLPGRAGDVPLRHELAWLPRLAAPRRGATGVPHFVFNGSESVSGAVPAAVLLRAMRRAIERQALVV